ncbi:MAG TPA: hypothetical protein VKR32_19185 [Puia sp.]|nr:hypothetical protein [Puia sp.]
MLVAGAGSCNSKCSCTTAPGLNLSLIFFGNTDIDTIVLKKYVKASGFTGFLGSVLIDRSNSLYETFKDTIDVIAGDTYAGLNSSYDYEILFPAAGIQVKVTEIDEIHAEGNCSSKTQCTDPVDSYKINDSLITKPDPFDNKIAIWN